MGLGLVTHSGRRLQRGVPRRRRRDLAHCWPRPADQDHQGSLPPCRSPREGLVVLVRRGSEGSQLGLLGSNNERVLAVARLHRESARPVKKPNREGTWLPGSYCNLEKGEDCDYSFFRHPKHSPSSP